MTYSKWIDFEENVLLKYLENESSPIPDVDEYKILIEIIKKSLKGTTEEKEPAYNLNNNSLGLRDLE